MKMFVPSLFRSIVAHIMKAAQSKNTVPVGSNMAPALVETYSRLLVYTEIESLGIKGFLSKLCAHKSNIGNLIDFFLHHSIRSTLADRIQIAGMGHFAHTSRNALISHASHSIILSCAISQPFAFVGRRSAHKSNANLFMR